MIFNIKFTALPKIVLILLLFNFSKYNNNFAIVLIHFYANPHTSIRAVTTEMILIESVHRIIKENKYHLFKLTLIHLHPQIDEI